MEELKSWIENHPYVTGSVVLGIIVLILISRGGSSAPSQSSVSVPVQSGNGSTSQTAQLQAATQVAALQNNAVLQTNLANAGLAAKQLDNATKITIAGYQRDVLLDNNATAYGINKNNNATVLDVAAIQAQQQSLFKTLINSTVGTGKSGNSGKCGGVNGTYIPCPGEITSFGPTQPALGTPSISSPTNYARPVASFPPPSPVATTGTGPIGSLRGR